ncbi:MAG: hypothetical protein ABJD97_01200, partial [Betaproteobacteria bacterium]
MRFPGSIGEEVRLGARVTRDGAVWKELAAAAFAPKMIVRTLATLVFVGLCSLLSGLLLGGYMDLLAALGLSIWIWPPVLRWFVGTIARRAAWPLARTAKLAQFPRPDASVYRQWWLPVLACATGYRLLDKLGLGSNERVTLAMLALQAHLAAPALMRSLLVSWFPLADIDAVLAARRRDWSLLAAGWMVTIAVVYFVLARAAGFGGFELLVSLVQAWLSRLALLVLLAKIAFVLACVVATGVFCTATAAAIGARWMLAAAASNAPAGQAAPDWAPDRTPERAAGEGPPPQVPMPMRPAAAALLPAPARAAAAVPAP